MRLYFPIRREIVEKLINERQLSLVTNDDDEALITCALDNDAFLLTNDRFKDHKGKDWFSTKKMK